MLARFFQLVDFADRWKSQGRFPRRYLGKTGARYWSLNGNALSV